MVGRVDGAGDVALLPFAELAHVEHLQRRALLPALVQLGHRHARDARDRQLVLAPARHPAGEVARDVGDADRGRQPDRAAGVVVVAADDDHGLVVVGQPRQPRAEAGAQHGDADRAGDVRVVELQLGADVDDERAVALVLLDLARRERIDLRRAAGQRPGVDGHDGAEVRRLRAEPGDRALDELLLVDDAEHLLVGALVADRRGDLEVDAGPPHIEPPRCPGHTSHVSGSVSRPSCSEWKMPCAPSRGSTARSGRAMPPTKSESPVSTAHGSGPRSVSIEREGGVLGPVAGGVHGAHHEPSERELPAVVEGLVVVLGRRRAVDVDGRSGRRGQPPVPGDVVGVVVGLEHVLDAHAEVAGQAQVLVDVQARIDDGGDRRVVVAHEIAGAAEVVVGDLAEDHGPSSLTRRVPVRARPHAAARQHLLGVEARERREGGDDDRDARDAGQAAGGDREARAREAGDGARLDVAQPRPARHHQREDRRHPPAHRVGRDHLVDRAAADRADAVGGARDREQDRGRPQRADHADAARSPRPTPPPPR